MIQFNLHMRPPLVSDRDQFLAVRFFYFQLLLTSCKRSLDVWIDMVSLRWMYRDAHEEQHETTLMHNLEIACNELSSKK